MCIRDSGAAVWRGTPLLNRRPARESLADWRLLVVGDAAGYVEPFTGEGIAWALASGWSAGELASRPWTGAVAGAWIARIGRLRRRQRACRAVAAMLRRPRLTRWVVAVLGTAPALARPVIRSLNRPVRTEPRSVSQRCR